MTTTPPEKMPAITRLGCGLLICYWLATTATMMFSSLGGAVHLESGQFILSLFLPALTAIAIALVVFGYGWARFPLLLVIALSIATAIVFQPYVKESNTAKGLIFGLIEIVGITLLFAKVSRAWFNAGRIRRGGLMANPFGFAFSIVFGIPFFILAVSQHIAAMEMVMHTRGMFGTGIFIALIYFFMPPAMLFGRPHFSFGIGVGPADWQGYLMTIGFYVVVALAIGLVLKAIRRVKSFDVQEARRAYLQETSHLDRVPEDERAGEIPEVRPELAARPQSVRYGCYMLFAGFLAGVGSVAFELLFGSIGDPGFYASAFFSLAFNGVIVWGIWNGVGWLRFLAAMLFLLGLVSLGLAFYTDVNERAIEELGYNLIDVAGLVLLYTKASRDWFADWRAARGGISANPFFFSFSLTLGIPYFLDVLTNYLYYIDKALAQEHGAADLVRMGLSYYYLPPAMLAGKPGFLFHGGNVGELAAWPGSIEAIVQTIGFYALVAIILGAVIANAMKLRRALR